MKRSMKWRMIFWGRSWEACWAMLGPDSKARWAAVASVTCSACDLVRIDMDKLGLVVGRSKWPRQAAAEQLPIALLAVTKPKRISIIQVKVAAFDQALRNFGAHRQLNFGFGMAVVRWRSTSNCGGATQCRRTSQTPAKLAGSREAQKCRNRCRAEGPRIWKVRNTGCFCNRWICYRARPCQYSPAQEQQLLPGFCESAHR